MAARRFPVEAGHVLALRPGARRGRPRALPVAGDVAPPTFAIAAARSSTRTTRCRPRPGVPWHGSGGDAGLVTEE